MKFRFIRDHRAAFPVRTACRVLGVSSSGFYAWLRQADGRRAEADRDLSAEIAAIHAASRGTYGSPRVHAELRHRGCRVGRKRVARLMRASGLQARRKRRFRATTDSRHAHPVAPNLLEQRFEATRADAIWLADITYVPTAEGWLYLAMILDLFTRQVVGWAMDQEMPQELTLRALAMAQARRRPLPGLIHHSDRGSQYAASAYQDALREHGIRCSMSRRGNCFDNAPAESFFGTLKTELVHRQRYATRAEAKHAIFEFIEVFYNRQRRHSALGYRSPAEFESMMDAA
jgi:transposase InsO family protein